MPTANQTFDFLSYASATGVFSSYTGTSLSNGLILRPIQTATDLSLTTAPPPEADLSVLVKAQPALLTLGGSATFTATVTDTGPNDAQGVVLTDTLPSGVTPFAITTSAGTYILKGNVVTLTIPTLADGSSATLTISETPTARRDVHRLGPWSPAPAPPTATRATPPWPPFSSSLPPESRPVGDAQPARRAPRRPAGSPSRPP